MFLPFIYFQFRFQSFLASWRIFNLKNFHFSNFFYIHFFRQDYYVVNVTWFGFLIKRLQRFIYLSARVGLNFLFFDCFDAIKASKKARRFRSRLKKRFSFLFLNTGFFLRRYRPGFLTNWRSAAFSHLSRMHSVRLQFSRRLDRRKRLLSETLRVVAIRARRRARIALGLAPKQRLGISSALEYKKVIGSRFNFKKVPTPTVVIPYHMRKRLRFPSAFLYTDDFSSLYALAECERLLLPSIGLSSFRLDSRFFTYPLPVFRSLNFYTISFFYRFVATFVLQGRFARAVLTIKGLGLRRTKKRRRPSSSLPIVERLLVCN